MLPLIGTANNTFIGVTNSTPSATNSTSNDDDDDDDDGKPELY